MITLQRLDAGEARRAIEGARRHAEAIGVPMCMAVTDESGTLIAFERMDGGKVHSVQVAQDKAFTACSARRPTHEIGELAQPGGPLFGLNVTLGGRISIVAGGLPIVAKGQVIGGIGVSSGTPQQDLACATAALAALCLDGAEAQS